MPKRVKVDLVIAVYNLYSVFFEKSLDFKNFDNGNDAFSTFAIIILPFLMTSHSRYLLLHLSIEIV